MLNQKLVSQIQEALEKEQSIIAVYVLGSVINGRVRDDSDFDVAVVVENRRKTSESFVYDCIAHIAFPKNLDLSIVDNSSSPLFLYQMVSTGKCIYERSNEDKTAFEAHVLKNYYDNKHMRNIYYSYLKYKFPYGN